AIAGPVVSKDLGLNAQQMGFIFSAFGWSYFVAQLPGGWLLDRFGSKSVYAASLALWSVFTIAQGFVGFLVGALAVVVLFVLRFMLGSGRSAVLPGQRPHRRRLVPAPGARHRLGDLQLRPVL